MVKNGVVKLLMSLKSVVTKYDGREGRRWMQRGREEKGREEGRGEGERRRKGRGMEKKVKERGMEKKEKGRGEGREGQRGRKRRGESNSSSILISGFSASL